MPNRRLIEWAVDVFTLMLGLVVGSCTGVVVYGTDPYGVGSMIALFLAAGCVMNLLAALRRQKRGRNGDVQ